ncbi:MAG: uracil phosphoribosyltransferase [Bdellovibrionales bacterium]|nr:uracil phosphoribosyltransferase [Bdellovibrionales bacterium]
MGQPTADLLYRDPAFRLPEAEHRYGPRVHLLTHPLLLSWLERLCSPQTKQPLVNELLTRITLGLFQAAVNAEFPRKSVSSPTRMAADHPTEGVYRGAVIDPEISAVTVNLARAGTVPSQLVYQELNLLLNPDHVRQDHVSIARQAGADHKVTGSHVSGHKIGGRVDGAMLFIPDPMGATGSTVVEALSLYRELGKPRRVLCMHCIVTPEYLKKVTQAHPEVEIYAVRLDRGLSAPDLLATVPGTRWSEERGLNDRHYIVPGGGGFGEILNNAFV